MYAQAWAYTISNAVLLGPPIYGLVSHLLVVDRPCSGMFEERDLHCKLRAVLQ